MSKWEKDWRKKHGDFAVPCIISERYLRFSDKGTQRIGAGEVLWVDVMTNASENGPRKLCQLAITREHLMQVLQIIEPPSKA